MPATSRFRSDWWSRSAATRSFISTPVQEDPGDALEGGEGLDMADAKVGARVTLSLDPRRLYLFGADGRRLAPP